MNEDDHVGTGPAELELPLVPTVAFTADHARKIDETHAAITELRELVGSALPQVEKMVSSGPMGLMLGSLFRKP